MFTKDRRRPANGKKKSPFEEGTEPGQGRGLVPRTASEAVAAGALWKW